jgi:hypothetical protein
MRDSDDSEGYGLKMTKLELVTERIALLLLLPC